MASHTKTDKNILVLFDKSTDGRAAHLELFSERNNNWRPVQTQHRCFTGTPVIYLLRNKVTSKLKHAEKTNFARYSIIWGV